MEITTYGLFLFEQFGRWFYVMVLFLSFAETVAFVGTLLPGGMIIVAIGFLSVHSNLNVWWLIFFAGTGAMLGDTFSYWLGTKGKHWFRHENRFLKIAHLEKAERYFKKHGDKSVFFGRFIGFLRPIIPFVAGLSKMNLKKFLSWSIIGAFLWATSHIGLGYFLGLSFNELRIPKNIAFMFVSIPIIIIFIWTIFEYRGRIMMLMKK